jgi:hypothetical protein
MVNVLEIEDLFDVYHHNDLDMNSKKTKADKDIYLTIIKKIFMKSKKNSYVHNWSNVSYQVQY